MRPSATHKKCLILHISLQIAAARPDCFFFRIASQQDCLQSSSIMAGRS